MYEEVLLEAFELEDVVKCRQLNDYSPRLPTNNPFKKAVWFYKCAIRGIWHRVRQRYPMLWLPCSFLSCCAYGP